MSSSTRVVVLAPIANSPFSRSVCALVAEEPGLELVGIVCRRILNPARLRSELKRDGVRLARKAFRKIVLAEADDSAGDEPGFHDRTREAGVADLSLDAFARQRGIPIVHVADHNDDESIAAIRDMRPDVVGFTGGGIIRQKLIDVAGRGIFNTHMGPLPAYRGMDVVEWPILEADAESEARSKGPELGVTLHFMDKGIDTGPIVRIDPVPIRHGDTMERLRRRFEPVMVDILLEGLRWVRDGGADERAQAEVDGRQYFVMHPRLYEEARRRLARFAERAGDPVD
ncbi:MAG: hypothetical protein NXI30_17010 [bacterium]|nr:hypothetical protein [bacterium]